MVRSLTSTLNTALNSTTRRPAITLTAEDHVQHYRNFLTSVNADAYHDACVASDGSIVRVQLTRGGTGFNQNFQYQRITNPNTGSQWTTWTTFSGGSGNMFDDGDCCISNNSGTLRAFAMHAVVGTTQILTWSSTNNGVSWSGPTVICNLPAAALIKGIGSGGNNDVFYLYDVSGGETIGYNLFSGGLWSITFTWTGGLAGAYGTGLCVLYDGQYHVIWSDGYALYLAVMSIAGSWTKLQSIAPAASTAILRIAPRIKFDSVANLYNLTCIEYDNGSVSGVTYQYPRNRQSLDLIHYSSGTIFHDISCFYGACILHINALSGITGDLLITQPTIQYAADFSTSTTTQYKDLSAYILSYIRIDYTDKPNELEIVLDNNTGQLSSFVGIPTSYQPIAANTTLVLSEGYKTGSPPTTTEVVTTGRYRVNKIQFLRTPDENQIKIIAYDNSRLLDIVNRFQNTYLAQTVAYLVTEVCTRAGIFNIVLPGTAQVSNIIPAFVLQSGQTYRQALAMLCDTYQLDYFTDETEQIIFRELSGADTSVWSYQNEITAMTFGSDDMHGNHVIVTGKTPSSPFTIGQMTTGEAYDDNDSHFVGGERLVHHVDSKLTTITQCASKAAFLLTQEQRAALEWTITVPLNPALQQFDVVSVADTATGGSGQSGNARIIAHHVAYHAQSGTYSGTIDMSGV